MGSPPKLLGIESGKQVYAEIGRHSYATHLKLKENMMHQLLFRLGAVSQATKGIEGGQMENCTSLTHLEWHF